MRTASAIRRKPAKNPFAAAAAPQMADFDQLCPFLVEVAQIRTGPRARNCLLYMRAPEPRMLSTGMHVPIARAYCWSRRSSEIIQQLKSLPCSEILRADPLCMPRPQARRLPPVGDWRAPTCFGPAPGRRRSPPHGYRYRTGAGTGNPK